MPLRLKPFKFIQVFKLGLGHEDLLEYEGHGGGMEWEEAE